MANLYHSTARLRGDARRALGSVARLFGEDHFRLSLRLSHAAAVYHADRSRSDLQPHGQCRRGLPPRFGQSAQRLGLFDDPFGLL